MIEWPRALDPAHATLSDLESHSYPASSRKRAPRPDKTKGRHVRWEPDSYTLRREGVPLGGVAEVDALFKGGGVEERHFYIFQKHDPSSLRNEVIPLYEAVYRCGDAYVRVQKKHLAMAYRKLGRSRKEKMWSMLENGLPYWVDRYCFSMMGQRDSKKRYEKRRRESAPCESE